MPSAVTPTPSDRGGAGARGPAVHRLAAMSYRRVFRVSLPSYPYAATMVLPTPATDIPSTPELRAVGTGASRVQVAMRPWADAGAPKAATEPMRIAAPATSNLPLRRARLLAERTDETAWRLMASPSTRTDPCRAFPSTSTLIELPGQYLERALARVRPLRPLLPSGPHERASGRIGRPPGLLAYLDLRGSPWREQDPRLRPDTSHRQPVLRRGRDLFLSGEVPKRNEGRMMDALLVSAAEHSLIAPTVDA
jgi:hypothetical protein